MREGGEQIAAPRPRRRLRARGVGNAGAGPEQIRPVVFPPPSATAGPSIPPKASASMARGCAASQRGEGNRGQRSRRGRSSVMAGSYSSNIFPAMTSPGAGRWTARFRCDDQARHALGLEERDLPAGRHRDRSQADQERRRTCRQILSGLLSTEIAGLGQHHPAPSPDHVVGHAMGREPRLEGSQKRRAASGQRSRSDTLCPVEANRGSAGHGVDL